MSAYCLLLRKDLSGPLPAPQWPQGVRLTTLRDELLAPAHSLLCEEYASGAGSVDSLQAWRRSLLHDAEFDPQLCLIAIGSAGVVGVAQGWTSAYLKDLAVAHQEQGRGVGQALLAEVFAVYRKRGEPWVDLKVMEANHRARRLYERAGMVQVQRIAL